MSSHHHHHHHHHHQLQQQQEPQGHQEQQQQQQQHQQQQQQQQHQPLAHLQHRANVAPAHAHQYVHQHAYTDHNSAEVPRRLTLPDRNVTAATIEDAYVRFIFYCNPALPLGADAQSLREAFRNPPRSGGKLFSPFIIFELVRRFYVKEIKTWTELTTMLGVEPPDPGKDESTQKIAQYGVRLKKWMNSMHIKAFFEYLMDIPNEYWTQIPDGPDPIAQPVRDGIAVEDDMCLRALLPHIRPKRGRKRPDDQPADNPSQKQRFSPPTTHESLPSPWPKQNDPMAPRTPIIDAARPGGTGWDMNNLSPTPNDNWSGSGGSTPPTRNSFWDDALEQQSAITPPKSKAANQRRGAKNVSSAWKSSGWDPASAKTRGRPPLSHRTKEDGLGLSHASLTSAMDGQGLELREASAMALDAGEIHVSSYGATASRHDAVPMPVPVPVPPVPVSVSVSVPVPVPVPGPAPAPAQILITPPQGFTQALTGLEVSYQTEITVRPDVYRQVSDGTGPLVYRASPPAANSPPDGSQIATHASYGWRANEELVPPSIQLSIPIPVPVSIPVSVPVPVVPISIPASIPMSVPAHMADATPPAHSTSPRITSADSSPGTSSSPSTIITSSKEDVKEWHFEKMTDRSNIDPMISFFTHVLRNANWIDPEGNQQEPGEMAECTAMANATIENMYNNADSSQTFLINLAALAGARMLMTTRPRCYREEVSREVFTYHFEWQYRFGDLSGQFNMAHTVPSKMWKRQPFRDEFAARTGDGGMEPLTTEAWQRKYEALMVESEKLNREIFEMQDRVMSALK